MMSTDFAAPRVFPGCLFNLHVDCEREIDFDFFDDARSVPSPPSWRNSASEGSNDVFSNIDVQGGSVPSPRLTAGPTPDCNSADGVNALSTASKSLLSAPHPSQEDSSPAAAVEDSREQRAEPCVTFDDLADVSDDVVVGGFDLQERHHSLRPADAAITPSHIRPPPQATAVSTEQLTAGLSELTPGTSVVDGQQTGIRPQNADSDADEAGEVRHGVSVFVAVSVSGDSDEGEDVSVGIQEMSLTVSNRKTRAVSSVTTLTTSSSMTGVSSRDSDDDTDREDAMESIAKALSRSHRPRPPSSTVSSPYPGRPAGRTRRLNMSFSNDEARRIHHENQLLVRRIVSQRARQPLLGPPPTALQSSAHRCSHAVNRARRVKDIDRDNQILLKKIQTVKRSGSQLSMSRSSSSMSGRYSWG